MSRQLRTRASRADTAGEVFTLTVSFTQFHTCQKDMLGSDRSMDTHDCPQVASNWAKGSELKDMKTSRWKPC